MYRTRGHITSENYIFVGFTFSKFLAHENSRKMERRSFWLCNITWKVSRLSLARYRAAPPSKTKIFLKNNFTKQKFSSERMSASFGLLAGVCTPSWMFLIVS